MPTPVLPRQPASGAPASTPAVVALLGATASWGSLFLVGKEVLRTLDPVWFTALRYGLATLLLAALLPVLGTSPLRHLRAHGRSLALHGLAGYGAFSLLVFFGVSLSVPSHGAVIMATMPFTTLLVRWWRDGARPPARALAAGIVALAGVACVAAGAGTGGPTGMRPLAGDALMLLGTLGWVTYTRGAARHPGLTAFDYTALTAVASVPWLLLLACAASWAGVVPWPQVPQVVQVAPSLAYVALLPTVAAALAFNFGVGRLGAATGTVFLNNVPVSAMLLGAALGHRPAAYELAGAALVGSALVVATWVPTRQQGKAAGERRRGSGIMASDRIPRTQKVT